nr:hypothetical protein Iba_chr04aCG6490 [Ipomoea batatas]GME19524.1 hypothetical protein Iba_scaffold23068CG0020 [Ipomoea batatas]
MHSGFGWISTGRIEIVTPSCRRCMETDIHRTHPPSLGCWKLPLQQSEETRHSRCWFVDRPFLRQCSGTPHGERPRLKLSPLAAANHRYGLLAPEREAEGEGPLASSVALLLRVATGERDATRGSPLLSYPRWRRRVTPEATIAADSKLTKRRPSRCRSLEEKKQGVDRGASSSYATAQHRRCMEDVCRSPDCHTSSSPSPTSIGIALLVAAIASRSLPEEKARSFATERERRTGRKKEGTPHGERPRLKLSPLAAANHRYGLLAPEREAEGEGPLASSVALLLRVATGEMDATRGSPLLSCPRRRRRVTPEATIAADSELTKRRPSRCRSLEEKK